MYTMLRAIMNCKIGARIAMKYVCTSQTQICIIYTFSIAYKEILFIVKNEQSSEYPREPKLMKNHNKILLDDILFNRLWHCKEESDLIEDILIIGKSTKSLENS